MVQCTTYRTGTGTFPLQQEQLISYKFRIGIWAKLLLEIYDYNLLLKVMKGFNIKKVIMAAAILPPAIFSLKRSQYCFKLLLLTPFYYNEFLTDCQFSFPPPEADELAARHNFTYTGRYKWTAPTPHHHQTTIPKAMDSNNIITLQTHHSTYRYSRNHNCTRGMRRNKKQAQIF